MERVPLNSFNSGPCIRFPNQAQFQPLKYLRGLCHVLRYGGQTHGLLPGQGTVIEDKKIAYYKDEEGILHTYSAICTHLGCTVTWNNSEKSFDCPCHGSRFFCQFRNYNKWASQQRTVVDSKKE